MDAVSPRGRSGATSQVVSQIRGVAAAATVYRTAVHIPSIFILSYSFYTAALITVIVRDSLDGSHKDVSYLHDGSIHR